MSGKTRALAAFLAERLSEEREEVTLKREEFEFLMQFIPKYLLSPCRHDIVLHFGDQPYGECSQCDKKVTGLRGTIIEDNHA